MRISIFGLGYVGTVSAACFADLGHEVMGVDVSSVKVEQVKSGQTPIVEAGLGELIAKAVEAGALNATQNTTEAIHWADCSLVCVGTPSRPNGSLDTAYVEEVCREIGTAIKGKTNGRHTVIIRSTLLPGTTLDILKPILEEASGLEAGKDFGLAYNPEFLRESTAVKDFAEPPFTIVGGIDESSADVAASIYDKVKAPVRKTKMAEAEMIKYACNAFHANKITFANEIGNFAKTKGVDGHVVMDIICQDKKLNLSSYYMKPGFAYGGSCLPKDVRALLFAARSEDLKLPLVEALSVSNENQIRRGIELVLKPAKRNVGVLGFSFKAGTDDLRESPTVELIETILGKGCQLKLYDKNVQWAKLMGANKSYILSVIPHISDLMVESMDDVIANSDVIVIGNSSSEFAKVFAKPLEGKYVVDLVRFKGISQEWLDAMGDRYQGICW